MFKYALLISIIGGGLYIYYWSLKWVYKDAKKRTKNSRKVTVLAALLFWPLSLLVWVFRRPSLKLKRRSGSGKQICTHCQRTISTHVALCPYCGKMVAKAH
ncbi:MAG: hypothetical protein ABI615_03635 [Chthoniobacterales bacterium]